MLVLLVAAAILSQQGVAQSVLIRGGTIYDGSGAPGRVSDLRIAGGRIVAIGSLRPRKGERLVFAKGLAVAPGFIDAHSHADGNIAEHPLADSQVTQGITTAVVGQDGDWDMPVANALKRIEAAGPALNFAYFSGHGGIRRKILKDDFKRAAMPRELTTMKALIEEDMKAGALGLSTGLEYDPGFYASTEELIECARAAAKYGGVYSTHQRDEGNGFMKSLDEALNIGKAANVPVHISHVKLGTAKVWGLAKKVIEGKLMTAGADATADVYPYLYWQSTISVLTLSKDWANRRVWKEALADVGGAQNVLLSKYTHNPGWVGKTIAEISASTSKSAPDVIMEIVARVHGPGGSGDESVVVTAMEEQDVQAFASWPNTMFCSDGSILGTHPRGAGAFPRIIANYVRKAKLFPVHEAIRKMTSLPARRFGLKGRGVLRQSGVADVVVFDPRVISDRATPVEPRALSVGLRHVWVSGVQVLEDGRITGRRPGRALRRGQ